MHDRFRGCSQRYPNSLLYILTVQDFLLVQFTTRTLLKALGLLPSEPIVKSVFNFYYVAFVERASYTF